MIGVGDSLALWLRFGLSTAGSGFESQGDRGGGLLKAGITAGPGNRAVGVRVQRSDGWGTPMGLG